jgi:hypothetical protein
VAQVSGIFAAVPLPAGPEIDQRLASRDGKITGERIVQGSQPKLLSGNFCWREIWSLILYSVAMGDPSARPPPGDGPASGPGGRPVKPAPLSPLR